MSDTDKPAEQAGTGWAKTMHPDLGNELVRRWNAFEPMQTEIELLRAEVEYWKGMAPPAVVRDFPFRRALEGDNERLRAGINAAIADLENEWEAPVIIRALRKLVDERGRALEEKT